jgi:hypothetical protein
MSKYLLIECNRLRGKSSYNNLDEESDKFKNSWVNLVSNTGIVVNAGDTISLEQVILNSKGASDEVIEFLGEENEEGFVDNQVNLEYSFYINHCGQNTARMPFIYHKTYRGQGDITNPNRLGTGDSDPWEFSNGNILAGTDPNLYSMLSRRSLGETFFPKGEDNVGNRDWSDQYFYTGINDYYMGGSMITRLKTIQTGGGQADTANSGYSAGIIYNTRYFGGDTGQGVGMQIRIESVTTSGNVGGIVQSWSVFNVGFNYDKGGQNVSRLELFEDTGGDAVVGTTHILELHSYVQAETFSQSGYRGFNGERFSFLNEGYSGLASEEEGSQIQDPTSTDTSTIIQTADKRKKKINLNIDEGFLTPDNVGAILTDQLHEPTLINKTSNEKADFLDYNTLEYFHRDARGGFSAEAKPIIVATPTYQPQSCNMYMEGIPNTKATLIGARRGFYHQLAYKNADRFCGLKNAFWNFAYFQNDFNTDNDIVTGTIDSNTQGNQLGDFSNLSTGELGCRVCLLNDFPEDGDSMTASFNKNGLFLTNMKWNQSNIQRLKDGFRKAEFYLGDLSKQINTDSDDYKNSLAVNLDLGMYDDEESQQFPLLKNPNNVTETIKGARIQFATHKNGTRANVNLTEYPTDFNYFTNNNEDCKSCSMRNFPESIENDGQELGSIWVRSRWQNGFTYDNTKDTSYTDTKLDLGFLTDNAGQEFDTTINDDVAEQDFFKGTWIDSEGKVNTTETAIQEAIDADLAIVPVFTNHFQTGKFGIDNDVLPREQQTPYIAFVNAMRLGSQENHPDFDKVNLANPLNRWTVDYFNIGFGFQLGLDHSFTRNEAVCLVSPMIGNEPPLLLKNYMNVAYIGAVNPSIQFNPQLSRFEISGLNTPQNIGNGLMSSIPELLDANPNPEQTCFKIARTEQICNSWGKMVGDVPIDPSTSNPYIQQDATLISQFDDAQQDEGSIMDSQSGIAIEGIYLLDKNGNETQIQNTDISKYQGTIFDKLGFEITQLLPKFGSSNAFFTNQFTFQETKPTYATGLNNMTKPATTGAYISSAEIQTTSLNELNLPLYDLGVNTATRQATPDISEGTITAFKLADKLSFPYFCVYSSIPSGGTDTQWIGGEDGHSKLPCMGYLTRENNIGDFYYNAEQTFEYTATKDFTLTEIETDIRLPDGKRPRFEGHSAVIYKITKPLNSLPQLAPPISSKKKSK